MEITQQKKIDLQYYMKYVALALTALSFVVFGFLADTPAHIWDGLKRITIEPAILITDYVAIGGVGAAFINAGILMLLSVVLLYLLKVNITGIYVASTFLMGSFGLFGKNLINVWPIILGVFLYSRLRRESFKSYVHIAFLTTGIAPIVTEFWFVIPLPPWARLISGLLVGVSIGMLITPLSSNMMRLHKGFNLYNVGFSVGMLGTIYASLLKSYGYSAKSRLIWSTGNNHLLGMFLGFLFVSMIIAGILAKKHAIHGLKEVFQRTGSSGGPCFIELDGFETVLINMGINGLVALGYILLVGGDLNGPTAGGILTVAGFGGYGKHAKNIAPIFIGVLVGGLTGTWNLDDPGILIAALFGTALAPIAGHYGWIWGVVAGYINTSVVTNASFLHGWMNLYNTGFSAGIVASIVVPLLEAFCKKKRPKAEPEG